MSNKNELVSIVIPCFNDGEYLEEAVQSALNSTYKNIEIIIVDDGSTDNTNKIGIALSAKYQQVQYIYKNNAGLPAARNTGIEKAVGKYILPLDADDLISEDYIFKAINYLQNNERTKVVYCNAEFFELKKGKWKLPPFSISKLAKNNMIFCSAIYRKNEWERVGGYSVEMDTGWEDWEFWISVLKDGGFVFRLPITGFYYRVKKGSMRKGMSKKSKAKSIVFLNSKHSDFFERELGGPLCVSRGMSKIVNRLNRIFR